MLAAPKLLREYEFISRIPAGLLADADAPQTARRSFCST
jgi:hypothetical protein